MAAGITALVGGLLFGLIFWVGSKALDEGDRYQVEKLEKKVVEQKSKIANYEHVREYLRAKLEQRPPRLTPDEADDAKETAELVAEKFEMRVDLDRSY
jgi:hypothetical protein